MLEILQNFEQASAKFAPIVLIIPGTAAVVLGLVIWLRGLSIRRLLAGLIGAIIGAICGFFLFSRNIITTAIAAGICALVAVIFKRLIIAIMLAVLVTAICFIILTAPYMAADDEAVSESRDLITEESSDMNIQESLQVVSAYAVDFVDMIKKACRQMPFYKWAIVAVPLVILIVPGLIFGRLSSALFFAALGTLLIFAGMILLLLFKGTMAISGIAGKSSFYGIAIIIMIIFGTLEQFLLCRDTKRQSKMEKPADDEKQEPRQPTKSWRNK